jgi:type IV pilus assembly protein PilP
MRRRAALFLLPILLGGCGGDNLTDLKQWMQHAGLDHVEKLKPLPSVKPPDTFAYDGTNLTDPFKPRNLKPRKGGGGEQPDFNRPKEPLELYSLDGLKMVGTLQQKGRMYALVHTPDNTLYRVKVGDHIGQNFGVITGITENAIQIKEIVQDSAGDWTDSNTSLPLQE